jgi:hypothetical protein
MPSGSVSLQKTADLIPMLVWSLVLPVLTLPAIFLVLRGSEATRNSASTFSVSSGGNFPELLGGILLVTVVMIVLHEGLHGLVFWLTTREAPKFDIKFYYASASPGDWYLPRRPFLVATLLPLVAITAAGLLLLPLAGAFLCYLLILLVVFNASGAAGDLVVALRLAKLPPGTLAHDTGAEVTFFSPIPPGE